MQRRIAPRAGRMIVLQQHTMALVPRLLPHTVLPGICIISGDRWHLPLLVIVGIVWMVSAAVIHAMAWRAYKIRLQHERIEIRRLRFGTIEQVMYALPGLRGITRQESFLGRLFDVGTIAIMLPDRTIYLTMLTPFSQTADVLGFDR